MTEYNVWGGYSYAHGTEEFDTILDAAEEYVRRCAHTLYFYPLWGEVGPDDYVITTEHEGWTLSDLQAMIDLANNEIRLTSPLGTRS